MGKRGGTVGARPQNESYEERKRREACDKLSERTPMGAFTDDPSADAHDRHGRVIRGSNSNLIRSPWDLGSFPPND